MKNNTSKKKNTEAAQYLEAGFPTPLFNSGKELEQHNTIVTYNSELTITEVLKKNDKPMQFIINER